MSDFRETIRQLSNTPEQYEQQLIKKQAIEVCDKLKNVIRERANKGLYQVCGENRIIKGIIKYPTNVLYSADNFYQYLVNFYDLKIPYFCNRFIDKKLTAGVVVSHEDCISRLDFYQNKFFGGTKWKTTTKLSVDGITFLSTLRDILAEDGIEISHFWNVVYNKWDYINHHDEWSYIRDEIVTSDSVTVEGEHDFYSAAVYSGYLYEFKF